MSKREFNRSKPRLTLEQYKHLQDIRFGRVEAERGIFTKLKQEWGVPQSTISTAVTRGIKKYDILMLTEAQPTAEAP